MTAPVPAVTPLISTPADVFASLAAALEAGRQRYREAEAAKIVPRALGEPCPVCQGFRRVEIHTVLGQAPRLADCLACT